MNSKISDIVNQINNLTDDELKELIKYINLEKSSRRINQKLFFKLYDYYFNDSLDKERYDEVKNIYDIKRKAMVFLGKTHLTVPEENACKEIWKEIERFKY